MNATCSKCWKRDVAPNSMDLAICKACRYELDQWQNFLRSQGWHVALLVQQNDVLVNGEGVIVGEMVPEPNHKGGRVIQVP